MKPNTLNVILERYTIANNGCWEYTMGRGHFGHGRIKIKGATQFAHRVSWLLHKGPIPDDLFVLHTCDNPPCINPDHLYLGTQYDIIKELLIKGRLTHQRIADLYNVHRATITLINLGRNWSKSMSLYNCKLVDGGYRISKFSNDLDVEASYLTDGAECDCPAGHRPVCRHRIMLARFIAKDATAGQWFHNYEHNQWIRAASDDSQWSDEAVSQPAEDDLASAASEVTSPIIHNVAWSKTFPDDISGEDLCKAFAELVHQPKPINLLELAKPSAFIEAGAITGRFTGSDHIEEIEPQPKPLRRL